MVSTFCVIAIPLSSLALKTKNLFDSIQHVRQHSYKKRSSARNTSRQHCNRVALRAGPTYTDEHVTLRLENL